MYGNTIKTGQKLCIPAKNGQFFILNNVALDPSDDRARLYAQINGKSILISQLDRIGGRLLSINICLEFQLNKSVNLYAQMGNLHIIGNFKEASQSQKYGLQIQIPTSTQQQQIKNIQSLQTSKIDQQIVQPPIRRSTRNRKLTSESDKKPISLTGRKKKDNTLSNMAAHFQLSAEDLQDDDDDDEADFDGDELDQSSSQSSPSNQKMQSQQISHDKKLGIEGNQENQDEDIVKKRRKLVNQQSAQNTTNFTRPTRNPYD